MRSVTDEGRLEVNQAAHPVDAPAEGRVTVVQAVLGQKFRPGRRWLNSTAAASGWSWMNSNSS